MVGDLGFEPRSSSSQSWWVAVTPVSVEMARATRIELAFIGRQPIAITRWLRPHELVPPSGLGPEPDRLRVGNAALTPRGRVGRPYRNCTDVFR